MVSCVALAASLVVSELLCVTVLLERKSGDVLTVIKKDWYPSSDAHVIVSSFQLDASGR